ncbi:MAG TPA: hypothetical protein VFI18_04085 [Gaiellales bacterium]|nr:hypothetical protein [Gaiellales bacterium]
MTTTVVRRRTGARVAIPLGFAVFALGVWAAVVPLVGPYFDFGFDTDQTWVWSEQHWTLSIIPGVVAAVAGIMIAFPTRFRMGALLGALAGAWLAVGLFLHPLWSDAIAPIATGEGKVAALWICYFTGPGVLIAYLCGVGTWIRRGTEEVVTDRDGEVTSRRSAPAEEREVAIR